LLMTLLKGLVGLLSGSIALTADAIHSLSDVASSLAVLIGLRIAQRKPDEKFSYGYYKAESIASLVVAGMIFFAGVEILYGSYNHLLHPTKLKLTSLAILISLVSALVSYALMVYKRSVGRKISSPALLADARHSIVDVYASLLVFLGIASAQLGSPSLEAVAGMVISILIIKTSFTLGWDSLLVLMDAWTHPEMAEKLRKIIRNSEGVVDVKNLRLRRSGPFIFGEAVVKMSPTASVAKAHEQTELIEKEIKKKIREIDSFIIHIEPGKKSVQRVAVPIRGKSNGIDARVSFHFGRAPYFLFADVEKGEIKRWEVKENPARALTKKIGMRAAHFLLENKVNILVAPEVGEGAFYALREHFVEIYKLKGSTAREAIWNLLTEKLKKMEV